jgi:hypothetical protein
MSGADAPSGNYSGGVLFADLLLGSGEVVHQGFAEAGFSNSARKSWAVGFVALDDRVLRPLLHHDPGTDRGRC